MYSISDSNFIQIPRGIQKLLAETYRLPIISHREKYFFLLTLETFTSLNRSPRAKKK